MIECRVVINDIIPISEPWSFSKWAEGMHKRLVDAGIPAHIDGTVDSGRLFRLDDPTDFGVTRYQWFTDADLASQANPEVVRNAK
jgi:hypothetical protein